MTNQKRRYKGPTMDRNKVWCKSLLMADRSDIAFHKTSSYSHVLTSVAVISPL